MFDSKELASKIGNYPVSILNAYRNISTFTQGVCNKIGNHSGTVYMC
jgi:hypothetical protein